MTTPTSPMSPMSPARAAHLRAEDPTYDVSLSPDDPAPCGFTAFARSRALPPDVDLDTARNRLLHWRVQRGAGLRVTASSERVTEGVVVDLRVGVGPLAVTAPCRVVDVVDEPDWCGFTYVTLPGHPEAGVESFTVTLDAQGRTVLRVAAVSRPATLVTRVGGPLGRLAQQLITVRYLRALDQPG
ncbi:DUF1990 domain-containing protein [Dermatophilaceae bacterium Soc4.6]